MFRSLVGVIVVCALTVSLGHAVDYRGTFHKADLDKHVVYLKSGNGQEVSIPAARDCKVFDETGKQLADGLGARQLKEGTSITFTRLHEGGEDKLLVTAIFIGGRKRRTVGDGKPTDSTGFKPLSSMTAEDRYLRQDGGLYGAGKNLPPQEHATAAKRETARIVPLDKDGKPAADGTIALISVSMSNGTQEFSVFKDLADADPEKSPRLTIVDCAQGSRTMAAWANPRPRPDQSPWAEAARRLDKAGVSPRQVQVAWIKPANAFPKGDLAEHCAELQDDTRIVLRKLKDTFPNLRIAYFTSRIYAGYARGPGADLNPEPYAYETAFAVRSVIQEQIKGGKDLNFDASRGAVKAPLLLWGPYLWADGKTPRQDDGLAWLARDISSDGIHPSEIGRKKVAEHLLRFFKSDPNTKTWFVRPRQ
jgi:hypothetical protein